MKKLIAYQLVVLALITVIAMLWQGKTSATSIFLGGAAYAVPTVLAVGILHLTGRSPVFSTIGLIYAEGTKVLLSLLWMAIVALMYPDIHWVSFIIGLLLVSHCIFFAFGEVVKHGKRNPE